MKWFKSIFRLTETKNCPPGSVSSGVTKLNPKLAASGDNCATSLVLEISTCLISKDMSHEL